MAFKHNHPIVALILKIAAVLTALGVIFGTAWGGYSHFQTASKAQQQHMVIREEALAAVTALETTFVDYQQKVFEQDKAERIELARRSIEQLEYQLLDPKLTPQERQNLQNQIRRLEAYIECVRAERPQC